MKNLEAKIRNKVKNFILEIIKEANKDENLEVEKISYQITKDFNLFERLNLPKKKIRKLDEEYNPDPVRYLFGDPVWCSLLFKDEKPEEVEDHSIKSHCYIENYEVFSFLYFSNSIFLIEDEDEEYKFKVIKRFDLNFDMEKN